MALALAVTNTEATQDMLHVFGTITASGSYSTGGDTLSFANLDVVKSGALPLRVYIMSARGAASPQTNLFIYGFAAGTTQASGKVQVFTGAAAQTALTELSAGAYPAGVTGDSIVFEAIFPRL